MYFIKDINDSFYAGKSILEFCAFVKDKRIAKEFPDQQSAQTEADKINKDHAPGYCRVWDESTQKIVE